MKHYEAGIRQGGILISESRYSGRSWTDVETDARSDRERRYPGSSWDNI